jgi:HAE1 family hydrophobic/amphiphilic exporter-1
MLVHFKAESPFSISEFQSLIFLLCVLCALCGSGFCAGSVFGAEVRTLNLDQALAIAMEKNRDIEKAREYGKYVQGKYVEERAAALPQLALNGSAILSSDESQKALIGLATRQHSREIDLTLSQPLFTWGKIGAAIRAAEVGLKTADEQLRLYRQAVYREVSTTFCDILLAKELSLVAHENLLQKRRHLEEVQKKFSSGVATDYDVLSATVAVDNARPEVIRTENATRALRQKLCFLLALDSRELDITGKLEADLLPPLPYQEALQTAVRKRPELADLRLRIGIYDELVKIAASDNRPRIDLKGGAGWHWLTVNNSGLSSSTDGPAWNIGVYLSFPFFDGLKSAGRVTQATSDLRTRQIEQNKLMDSIALEIRTTGDAIREASEIVQALSSTVKQAERLLQMAEKGYQFGVKISLEVDDAQFNLLQARSNLARAQRDYRVARVGYDWAMGVAGE